MKSCLCGGDDDGGNDVIMCTLGKVKCSTAFYGGNKIADQGGV